MGRASIAANLVTSGFLEGFDGASIHRCQSGNVGIPRSTRWGEHPSLPTWYRRVSSTIRWGETKHALLQSEAKENGKLRNEPLDRSTSFRGHGATTWR